MYKTERRRRRRRRIYSYSTILKKRDILGTQRIPADSTSLSTRTASWWASASSKSRLLK
jgi:hypothetical protein